ncbi:MAG: type IX secretion system membrane protein PorP/SprF [Bacteroidota bacterium]|nr:type IX secretion system membrane protein PorP/SprF [Bacteroidota bacterium]
MNKIISTIVLGLLSFGAFAQQDPGYSMYFFNPVNINPAYAGSREVFSGSLVHRSQWAKMEGAPTSQSLSIHSALPNSKVGLGLQINNDKAGPLKNTGVNFTYAYHAKVSEKAKLAFGVTGMVNNVSVGWDKINIDDNNDPAFAANANSNWVADAAAGLYLYKPRFYCGLSANHLLQSRFGLTDASGADKAKFYRQYYLTTGVVLPLTKSVDFRPSILMKYVQSAPVVGEIDASFIFFEKLFLGAGYRVGKRINMTGTDNMLIGILQFQMSNAFSFGYSYDYYLNRNGQYNSGTHEFMIGWDLSRTKTKMTSPRFF